VFGSKEEKTGRLERIVVTFHQQGELTVSQLAQQVDVPYQTIVRDLTDLEDQGILLQEHSGKVSLFQKR
jgi:DeoR/GlpR family transcriptional regulator of sugar metabolism